MQNKIAIFTRSMNYKMYESAMHCIRELPYPHHRLTGYTSDGYLFAMLRNGAEWGINIDEDAFVFDVEELKELIKYCIANNYVNCGMPDGGVVAIRGHNPLVTNPFFNIINLNVIKREYTAKKILNYSVHKKEYEEKTPFHMMREEYIYDYYEPYCNFFVWSSQNFKTLYLDARADDDGISTVLLSHRGKPFLKHTWYSREYGIDPFHTDRINKVIKTYSVESKSDYLKYFADKIMNKIGYYKRRFDIKW